ADRMTSPMPPAPSSESNSYEPRRAPAVSAISTRFDSFRKVHSSQQVPVARVVANRVKARVHLQINQPRGMILIRLFEPLERGILGSEAHVNQRDVKWRDVLLCRSLLQRQESLLRLGSLP